jgi:UDP-N-acetylmuramate: L-alanyl-gamma-D-glutamyl-meso-diaminopimelate ligase
MHTYKRMPLEIESIRNKQRIVIAGNHGLDKITKIVRTVLEKSNKAYSLISDEENITNEKSAIVILKGGNALENGQAIFHQFEPHIALIYKISEKIPDGYSSFDQYIHEIEKLVDNLPKAGNIVFNESDDVSTLIARNEREGVKAKEYTAIAGQKTHSGFLVNHEKQSFEVVTDNESFLAHAGAAKALLKILGISEDQFYTGIKAL